MFRENLTAALLAVGIVLGCSVTFCEARAQQYDYLVERGNAANQTAQQETDYLNQQSIAGYDLYIAFPEIHTGDTISIFRRPHVSSGAPVKVR